MAHGKDQHTEKLWNGNYIKIWLANFMIFFSFMLLTPLLPTYLSETFHADKDTIGMVLSGYTLTALVVRSLSGYMVDSFPRRVVLVASYALFCFFLNKQTKRLLITMVKIIYATLSLKVKRVSAYTLVTQTLLVAKLPVSH